MKKIVFVCVLVLLATGTFLRFYELTDFPPGLLQDEVIAGYDVYSLSLTGKDHHGVAYPLHFQTFNGWVGPFLNYLLLPFVSFWGLSAYAIRFPIAFLGSLSILPMFFAGYYLNKRVSEGLIAAFLFTFSSFAITTSRWTIPTYTVIFPLLTGLAFFLKARKTSNNKVFYYFLAFLFFGVTVYTYEAVKVFMLFFVPFTLWLFRKERALYAVLIFFLISLPAYLDTFLNLSLFSNRFTMVSIFSASSFWPLQFVINYFSYFLPFHLFIGGEANPTRAMPGFGYELLVYSIFFYSGFFYLIKKRQIFLVGYLLLSPIGPSLTLPEGDFQRSIHVLPALILTSTVGFFRVLQFCQKIFILLFKTNDLVSKRLGYLFLTGLVLLNCGYFLANYFGEKYVGIEKWYFQYGLENVVNYLKVREENFSEIVISSVINMPYSYVLFYKKVDPSTLHYSDFSHIGKNRLLEVTRLEKYRFRSVSDDEIKDAKLLTEIENSPYSIYQIWQKDSKAFVVFKTKM